MTMHVIRALNYITIPTHAKSPNQLLQTLTPFPTRTQPIKHTYLVMITRHPLTPSPKPNPPPLHLTQHPILHT